MKIEKSNDQDAFRAFEHAGWDARIKGYEDVLGGLTRQSVEATLDAAKVAADMRVLDVCTGPGMLAAGALNRGAQAVGLDFAENVVALAKQNVRRGEFHRGDAQDLPFADASFDAVVCGYGIIHLPEPEKALREMHRVARPGARVAVSVWEGMAPDTGFGMIYAAIAAKGTMDVTLPHGPDFFQFGTAEKLRAALGLIGFDDVDAAELALTWHIRSAAQIIDTIERGTVRARALFAAQSAQQVADIRAYLEEAIAPLADVSGGYAIPSPAIIGSGVKT